MNILPRRKSANVLSVEQTDSANLYSQITQFSELQGRLRFIDALDVRSQVILARTNGLSDVLESCAWDPKQPVHYQNTGKYFPLVYWYLHNENEDALVVFLRMDFYSLPMKTQHFVVSLLEQIDRKSELVELAFKTFRDEYKNKKKEKDAKKNKVNKDPGNGVLLATNCFKFTLSHRFNNLPQASPLRVCIGLNDLESFDWYGYCWKHLNKPIETTNGLADQIFQMDQSAFNQLGEILTPDKDGKLKRPPTALGQFLSDIFFLVCKLYNLKELKIIDYPLKIESLVRLSKFFKTSLREVSIAAIHPADIDKLRDLNLVSLSRLTLPNFSSLVSSSITLTRTVSDGGSAPPGPSLQQSSSSSSLNSSSNGEKVTSEEAYLGPICALIQRHAPSLEILDLSNCNAPAFVCSVISNLEFARASAPNSRKTVPVFPVLSTILLSAIKVTNDAFFDKLNSLSSLTALEIASEGAVETEKILSRLSVKSLRSLKLSGCTINHPDLLAELLSSSALVMKLDLSTSILRLQRLEELIEIAAPRSHGKLEIIMSLRDARNPEQERIEIQRINAMLLQKKKNIEITIA